MVSFPSYVETLLGRIENSLIEEDAKLIATLEGNAAEVRRQRIEEQQKAENATNQRNRLTSLLNEAVTLLSKREYQPAREMLLKLLSEDPDNGNAHFYLAQVASQTDQHEEALEYYTRAANTPDIAPWVQAWSLLRIGKYQAFQGQLEEARTLFDRVLGLEGDLRGAKEEAQESASRLQ